MERIKRLKKYFQNVYELKQKESSVNSIQESLKTLNNKEFVMRIPIGGKQNG